MNSVYLLTGGNIGEREQNLQTAADLIEKRVGPIIKKSCVYETDAWGLTDQAPFLNQVLLVSTAMNAAVVLQTILKIETELGRTRTEKMGPRTIDLDILLYNNDIISLPNLIVPHPHMQNRRFVLTPLHEIAPLVVHPVLHKTITELLHACSDELTVKKFEH